MQLDISFSKSKHFFSSPSFLPCFSVFRHWLNVEQLPEHFSLPLLPLDLVPCHSGEWDFDFLIDRFFSWLRLYMFAWEMPQLHSPSINSSLDLWLRHHFKQSCKHWKFRHDVSLWWYAAMGNIIHMVLHPALLLDSTPDVTGVHSNIPSLLIKTPS